ncbi:YdcF family protein [Candidatus Saccharibacteria bacterium]|nr:YdcF family protein [Candidatus Saccharibacteria bacterium]NCU40450.1 YdcF family protein [Candidatus Saccharibacteria bacterium]
MRAFLAVIVLIALVATIGLPVYLGPDDISSCSGPSDGKCAPADAIIVVSGGDTEARTAEAVRLYNNNWASLLVFSGAARDPNSPSNAQAMQIQAVESGVPYDAIILEEFATSTVENAANTASIIERYNLKRVILVTSAYHQRRTSIEFSKKLGVDVQIVNHPVRNDSQWSQWWWATPYGWWLGISELIKILVTKA